MSVVSVPPRRRCSRQDVMLRLHMGLSRRQIADELGVSLEVVRKHVARSHLSLAPQPEFDTAGARERVKREVAEGLRCKTCWLLSPCWDHR